MRTQSVDTSPEAERVLIALLRQKGVTRRFRITASLSNSMKVSSGRYLQQQWDLAEQKAIILDAQYAQVQQTAQE